MNDREREEFRILINKVNKLAFDLDKLKNAILLHPDIGDRVQKNLWS
tara:strand:+ start:50 stop:190 length:141 start_codon:yes stop_codon:yes gene_type:complete